jgi:hypothetical protein
MPNTSGQYTFQIIEVELIIREAFERIGILGEFVEAQKLNAARASINFLLLEWMNKSVNLWTLESTFLPLITNQGQYILENIIGDIVQVNLRTSTRQLNGTPTASNGGNAANAFDGDSTTSCDAGVDGWIAYDYGVGNTQQINFIGIQSATTTPYSLVVETSSDNNIWVNLYTIPDPDLPQSFTAGFNLWLNIPTPINARSYRIRETGGQTLNISELYFNNNVLDMPISSVSRYEYYTYPNKTLQGRPCIYYLDSQINPIFNLWPVPSSQYNCVQYTYKKMIQDVGQFTNALQIPQRFYQAMVWGLAYHMALKYNPQIAPSMLSEYDKSFALAASEDAEITPLRIYADYNKGNYL